ncbi:MAG: ImmA/IrrE family metallo-endopeptidase [Bacteroidota bacterium]|nr:ImmA/IrrE family metallo-endopeptidase [Bacteroidota bacterium]
MAKVSLLPRGFKSKAEKTAIALRTELGLLASDPLCGFKLAEHLNVKVFTPLEIFPAETNIEDLVGSDKGWSALTMKTGSDATIIIHNHLHAPARQQSNLMHEMAHIICCHKQPERHKGINLPFIMREFDPQQEQEANYLGSALQITRDGLLWALKKRMEVAEIAEHYNASPAMVTLRINTTAVKKQLGYMGY